MRTGYEVQGGEAGGGYRLDRDDVVLRGRRHELIATASAAVLLFVAQQPMRFVAKGDWTSSYSFDAEVSARLSLMIDLAFICAYVLVAYRLFGLVRHLHPPGVAQLLSLLGMCLVVAGALLDLVEDGILWSRDGDLSLGRFSQSMIALVGVGLLVELVALNVGLRARDGTKTSHEPVANKPVVNEPVAQRVVAAPAQTVICCSGGGIRSAAFSLGGLQVLTEKGIYQDASHVIGVSGGGYIGAAHHVLRWKSVTGTGGEWVDLGGTEAFAPASPELQWLRRHTRYVLSSLSGATRAGLSLAFGIVVNLVLVTIAIGALAWVLSWLLLASGRIGVVDFDLNPNLRGALCSRFDGPYGDDWRWVAFVWALPVLGLLIFAVEKVVNRFWTPGRAASSVLRQGGVWLLWGGGVATVLILGVPALLESLNRYAATSGSVYADLIRQLGLIDDNVCDLAVKGGSSGCGVSPKGGTSGTSVPTFAATSLTTVVGSILAVLASLKSAGGEGKDSSGGVGGLLRRVWAKVRDHVVPWLAVVLIVLVLVTLMLRWTAELTEDPGLLSDWPRAYWSGGLLLACFLLTEPNRTSMHHFFRERISYAFLVRRGARRIDPVDYKEPLRFSQSAPPATRGPRLVACAVANVSDEELVPSKRDCTPFVFDDGHIGLADRLLPNDAGRRPSAAYEFAADHRYRDATIPAAVAMSAAAFSPLAGRENVRLGPYRAVLALANARLGVWLPNPLWMDEVHLVKRLLRLGRGDEAAALIGQLSEADRQRLVGESNQVPVPATGATQTFWRVCEAVRNGFKKPGFSRLGREAFGKASVYDRFLYVTDGGHYDNLGLIEALRRRADRIYVIDASNDPEDTFRALGKAIASARMDLDCEVDVDPRGMRRMELDRAPAAWCTGTVSYSDGKKARIFMTKAIMLDGLPWDVETYSSDNVAFPRTGTNNQLYSEFDFEAYRSLGSQVMTNLLASEEYVEATS